MALKGVDVSVHQGAIDWKKVAKDGVKFAILRAGYGREISQKDKYFEVNYAGARAAGIKVGAYWYSYADSVARGEQEARTFLKAIEGKKFDLPLFFDQEYETAILKLSDATRTDIVLRFVKTVKAAGYECGLYSSTDFLKNKLVTSRVAGLKIWLAEYGSRLHYTGKVWAWQYSSKGRVSGIKGNVDMNHGYFEIAAPTKTQTQNSTGLLMKNDTGDKVKLLQHRLNILGNQLAEDGIWGVQTDQAVRNFQYNYGLAVDGIAGPKTQEKLISEAVVASARTISDYMLKNRWHYKGDGYTAKTTFAATKKLSKPGSSCAHFVSWVLQDVGLLQAGKILSHTKAGYGVGEKSIVNADKLIDCKVVYPNKSIDSYKSELKPGDVVVHDSSIGVYLLKDKKPAVLTGRNGSCINSKGQYVKMLVTSGYEWRHNVLAVVRANV